MATSSHPWPRENSCGLLAALSLFGHGSLVGTHRHNCTYTQAHTHVDMDTHTYMWTRAHAHMWAHTCTWTHAHTYTDTCIHVGTHTGTCGHTHIHAGTHTHVDTHILGCVQTSPSSSRRCYSRELHSDPQGRPGCGSLRLQSFPCGGGGVPMQAQSPCNLSEATVCSAP